MCQCVYVHVCMLYFVCVCVIEKVCFPDWVSELLGFDIAPHISLVYICACPEWKQRGKNVSSSLLINIPIDG